MSTLSGSMGLVEIVETRRLILRPWEPDDAGFVLDLYSRWEVQRHIGNPPQVMTSLAEAVERIEKWRAIDGPVHGIWAVQLKDASMPSASGYSGGDSNQREPAVQLAGTLLLKPIPASGPALPLKPSGVTEIGWHFHPDYWGNGYATEAAEAVLDYAFENALPRVVAVTNPANVASQRVCTRIGLAHRGQTDMYYNALCELFDACNPSA